MQINAETAHELAALLGAESVHDDGDHFRVRLANQAEKRILLLELYPPRGEGQDAGAMVVVYTGNSHLQLHNVTGWVKSEELGEVTFVGESAGRLSGLVVERGASCSLYANVARSLITGDFTRLGVEVMLSGVALSLAEDLLDDAEEPGPALDADAPDG
jgi:hypothetical protein